jgi:hypothetical protein
MTMKNVRAFLFPCALLGAVGLLLAGGPSQAWAYTLGEVGPAWSTAASACVPDEATGPLGSAEEVRLTFRPGTVSPAAPEGRGVLPITWRCAVPNLFLTAAPTWNALVVAYTDPDGDAGHALVEVTLKRHSRLGRRATVAHFSSAAHGGSLYQEQWVRVTSPFDFAHYTYWVEIQLTRRTVTTPAPRIFTVRLTTLQRVD